MSKAYTNLAQKVDIGFDCCDSENKLKCIGCPYYDSGLREEECYAELVADSRACAREMVKLLDLIGESLANMTDIYGDDAAYDR